MPECLDSQSKCLSDELETMILHESDLVFAFDDAIWQIKKYDDHPYYKKFSGVGLKGVDFIGLYKQKKVVFIEVKNFRAKHPTREEPFKVLTETKTFINHIGDKLEDTFRAVTAINAYFKKKWWYRFFLKWESYLSSQRFLGKDWLFWHQVYQLAQQKDKIEFVLWLEIEERISEKGKKDLSNHIDNMLEKQLSEFTNEVIVASVDHPTYQPSLSVTLKNSKHQIPNPNS